MRILMKTQTLIQMRSPMMMKSFENSSSLNNISWSRLFSPFSEVSSCPQLTSWNFDDGTQFQIVKLRSTHSTVHSTSSELIYHLCYMTSAFLVLGRT
mmetsp:Transcript_8421/g.31187  ORF Transcript_8421/g.31187 Transcript_8421/m.31187 type:complete len:97 (-) Transcript_8421:329-619(-)